MHRYFAGYHAVQQASLDFAEGRIDFAIVGSAYALIDDPFVDALLEESLDEFAMRFPKVEAGVVIGLHRPESAASLQKLRSPLRNSRMHGIASSLVGLASEILGDNVHDC